MEKLAKAKTSQDCHENLSSHQRAPGESPSLLHSANDEGKRGRQNHFEPHVQSLGSHGQSSAAINRRNIAHASLGCDDHRPQSSHHHDEKHGGFCLAKPQECQRHPADTGQRLQSKCHGSNRIAKQFPARGQQPQRKSNHQSNEVTNK